MPTPKPKAPTYGELSNIRTKLEMQQKNLKSKFPNDSVKVTHTMPDGKKITLSDVNKQLNKMNPKPKSIKDVAVPVKGLTKTTPKVGMKVTPKATTKPAPKKTAPKVGMKPTPLSKSERDFLAGQKLKAKITKRTGVYPNTAN
jgi:hypothetical protein